MEQTSSQVVRPVSVEVAVLLGEEGNSQEARPASEEGELLNDLFVTYDISCGFNRDTAT